MSKNSLLLNNHARNHIRFYPVKCDGIPESDKDQILWCQARFIELQNDGKRLFIKNNRKKGYLISVWEMGNKYYIIQSIRNEFSTYNNCIYIHDNKDDSLKIADFLVKNIDSIMGDYKQQIIEAGEAYKKEVEKNENNN